MSLFPPAQGAPELPQLHSLLVVGDYHASAPIHLAVSVAKSRRSERVILLSPSRDSITAPTIDLRDSWIHNHGGNGIVSEALSRIEVMYPPTPAHLALFLSSLHVAEPSINNQNMTNTSMFKPLAMIILHETSSYMSENPLGDR
jgi:hypothetical protein